MTQKSLLLASLVCFACMGLALAPVVMAQPAVDAGVVDAGTDDTVVVDAAPGVAEPAKADTGGTADYFKVVGEGVLPTLFLFALPILLLLIRRFIVYLEQKWNFDVSDQTEATLMETVSKAVNYAEEKAMSAIKTGDDIPDGAKKLKTALDFVVDEMQRLELDTLARDKLVTLIESKLFDKRAKGELPAQPKKPAVG